MGIRAVVWLVLFYSLWMPVALAANVKQSKAGICHVSGSTYYGRVKHYTAYPNLSACLGAGGRLPAAGNTSVGNNSSTRATAPSPSAVIPVSTIFERRLQSYSRDNFGRGWADSDRDCQNSRHEALVAQSTAPVRYKNSERCQVVAGRWISVFSGKVIYSATEIDIDHVVPLKWAWEHGAADWSEVQRVRFANDPANLISVEASLNRQKGAKGLDQWLPPSNQCQYTARFLRIMQTYQLQLSSAEDKKYQVIRSGMCGR